MSLLSIPPINQLDGSENARENCVATGVLEILRYYGNPGGTVDGLKDAVYGPNYLGGQDIRHYLSYMQARGVHMRQVTATPSVLIGTVRSALQHTQPVMGTIPSMWNDSPPPTTGSTHAILFVGPIEAGGQSSLTADNPWDGFRQTQLASWWQQRLRTGSVWVAEGVQQVAEPFTLGSDGWATYPDGTRVGPGAAKLLRQDNITELPLVGTIYPEWLGGAACTIFPSHIFIYDPQSNQTSIYSGVIAEAFRRAYDAASTVSSSSDTQAPAGAAEAIAAVKALEAAFAAIKG